MLTIYSGTIKRLAGMVAALGAAFAFVAGTAINAGAQPAPANDNITNAQGIIGSTGSINGDNLYATSETGEPAPVVNNPAQASIWYVWTAPYSTTMDFKTRGSTYITGPNAGGQLDTVMAVYKLKTGLNAAFTNLTLVASNDDDPSGGITSRIDFSVTKGSNYLIQIDGSTNTPNGSNAQGNIVLSWSPTLVGGDFGFSSTYYYAGALDDEIEVPDITHSTDPSLANKEGTNNIRIMVKRTGGATGRCHVTLLVTNSFYTNTYTSVTITTNIAITNIGGQGQVLTVTNIDGELIAEEDLYQNLAPVQGSAPVYTTTPAFDVFAFVETNGQLGFVGEPTLATYGLVDFFTNFPGCLNVTNGPITNSDNTSFTNITWTIITCSGVVTATNIIPAATNGVDYVAVSNVLTFNDFQMSQPVYLQINPDNDPLLLGPDSDDTNGVSLFGINSAVQLILTNVVLDSNEDLDITPPTLSQSDSQSTLDVLNLYGDPNNYVTTFSVQGFNNIFQQQGPDLSTNATSFSAGYINLERATFRVSHGVGTAYLYIIYTGPEVANCSYTVHYSIDCAGAGGFVGAAIGTTPLNAFNWNRFDLSASADYAVPNYYGVPDPDYGIPLSTPYDPSGGNIGGNTQWPSIKPYIGSITIGAFPAPDWGEIAIPILANGAPEFDQDMIVSIWETLGDAQGNSTQTVPGYIGNVSSAALTINYPGIEPGGANDSGFNPGSYPPGNPVPGANGGPVDAVVVQPNGQILIGGYFSSFNTTPVYGIARLNSSGLQDTSFNNVQQPGLNFGGFVKAIALDPLGRIIIGGSFSSYDGHIAPNIARLNTDGSLDQTFLPGTGFNSIVYALSVDTNGNILVGGDFTSYNTTNCNHIVRVMTNGGLDLSFLPNTGNGRANFGTDGDVNTLATDSIGNIVLGGSFTHVNGSNYNYLARLSPSGALDLSFNPEIGPDGPVYSLVVEQNNNNEILIGGIFQSNNLVSRPGIALIANDGSLDTSFTPGTGADGPVYSVLLQPDGNILVGGQFRNFNTSRRLGICRLLPSGWVDTHFMDTSFNQFAGLINTYYNDPVNIAYSLALQADNNIVVGGSFTRIGGGGARDSVASRINVARLVGAATPGPQTGGGGIGNCPGNITLIQNPYTVDDTAGKLFVTVDRVNGSLGLAQVTLGTNLFPVGAGDATAADFGLILPDSALYDAIYTHWGISPAGTYAWRKCDGFFGDNSGIQPFPNDDFGASALNLTIYDDKTALQNLLAGISELNINAQDLLKLGGVSIPMYPALGLPAANLEIINDNFPPGELGFSATNYIALDTSNSITITVLRTNGDFGPVNVQYFTANGTAIAGSNYTAVSAGASATLNFPGGPNNVASFTIPITPQFTVQSTKYFYVYLTNASYAGAFDTNIPPVLSAKTTVTIIDGNFAPGHLSFTSSSYSALKPGIASISVQRIGGSIGQLTVQVGTSDGSAVNGINYTGTTNTLTWGDQDVSVKTFSVQTLQDNTVDGPKTVNLTLFNATNLSGGFTSSQILTDPSNAVLTINDSDSYGALGFTVQNFSILENAGQALVTVVRTNGTTGTISVNFATLDGTNAILPYTAAQAGVNYGATNGQLVFGQGVTSQSFIVPIYDTSIGEAGGTNRIVGLELFDGTPGSILTQNPLLATLTILDPNLILNPAGSVDLTTQNGAGFNGTVYSLGLQPDGRVLAGGSFSFFNQYPFNDVARLTSYGAFDTSFLFNEAGANGTVYQISSETPGGTNVVNGPIVIAGNFTQVDAVNRPDIARLNLDGSVDETFNPGSGADAPIFALAEAFLPTAISNQFGTYYYIGGGFANFNGIPAGGIARLNASTNAFGYQGTVDPNFSVGQGVTGSNAVIYALAVQADGSVLAGGDFTSFNSTTYNHLIRIKVDGMVDTTFNSGTNSGPNGSVRAIVIQPDGRILVGGLFTQVNGSNYNYLARLNSDGTLDPNFNVSTNYIPNGGTNGGNNGVLALALDSQQRILVGGEFTGFSGVTRSGITRLNPDGTLDPTINFGSGADGGFVDTIDIQTNDEIDVGGQFATFEGTTENNFVRLFGGANSGDGQIQFSQSVYGVLENATNAVITLQRIGGEGTAAAPTVSITFTTSDGSAVAGTNYMTVTTNVTFPYGETFETLSIPILNNQLVGSNTTINLSLYNPVFAGIGPRASAIVIITNVNSAVSFSAPIFNVSAAAQSGEANITVVRTGFPNSDVGVTVYTGTNGSATTNFNYTPQTNFLEFPAGITTRSFNVPVMNPPGVFGNVTVDLEMSNPSNTIIGSPSSATLIINAVNTSAGALSFSQTNYAVNEGATNALITVIRTNGFSGAVAVTLTTSNGTAIAGTNYLPVSATLNFADGQTMQSTNIPIIQVTNASPDLTVYLTLSNPQGGAVIGGSPQEILTIQNDIQYFSFATSPIFVGEGAGTVTLGIIRGGPVSNTASVNYYTSDFPNASEANGDAVAGVDYIPTSGTLTYSPGETFSTIPITILQGNTVTAPLSFNVNLTTTQTNVQTVAPNPATVTILSDVTGFEFATNAYSIGENGSNLVITVNRLNPNTGSASVQFSTANGTNPSSASNAVNQVDYIGTNGTLTFLNGQASNSFSVTILNQNIVEGSKTFNVSLANPLVLTLPNPSTNAYLLAPSNTVVTITDVLAGVSFSSPSYAVSECGVVADIPVQLVGATNTLVSVNYATSDGSGIANTNYFPTNGVITFQPGQTSTNIQVQVINNHIIGPDHTVILTLSNPQGALLLNPSTSILNIQECNGAYIVKSGTAFVSGTVTNSGGVIFPNETVTVLFGLRDVAGSNTSSLVATLLATNGVTNVSGPQNYGALITNGPTVARPFTFTALGSNGQTVIANFTLQDGGITYSNVAFGFTLGGQTLKFSTNENLTLFGSNAPALHEPPSKASDATNPPAFGYPSQLNVSGVVGNVTGVTMTMSNFGHSFPSDVQLVLQSPTGQSTLLMYDCGGETNVQHISLTFSQSAGSRLPQNNALTSGTYLPTYYLFPTAMPTNGPGLPQPPLPPFNTNMNVFAGQSPNGSWSLFASDDDTLDSGYIDGWSLNLSTGIPVEADADLETTLTASPVSATLSNSLTYTITVTNYGPAIATNVLITNTLPPGVAFVSDSFGGTPTTNGVLVDSLATLAVSNGVSLTITVTPTNVGYLTNIVAAISSQPDPNSNNVQTNVTLVSLPSADLGVTLQATPNPALDGTSVTYTVNVLNNGPSTASPVTVIDVLPQGFIASAITPSQGLATNNNGMISWNVGTLGVNGTASMTIVAGINLPGASLPSATSLDSVTVSSPVFDPAKFNNFASVKTEVLPFMLTVTSSGNTHSLSWQAGSTNLMLQGAVTLSGPWVQIANPPAVNGTYTYVLPGSGGYHFFRLVSTLP